MNQAIADLVAERLPNLIHPGDDTHPATPIPLPMFRTSGIPDDQAAQFAEEAGLASANIAKITAEAIVHVIETDGDSAIIPKAELATLHANATAGVERHRQPRITCQSCGNPLFRINVDTENPMVNGKAFLDALATLSPECPHGPRSAT